MVSFDTQIQLTTSLKLNLFHCNRNFNQRLWHGKVLCLKWQKIQEIYRAFRRRSISKYETFNY